MVFEPVARGYDIQAYGHDFIRTMADAQAVWGPCGLITSRRRPSSWSSRASGISTERTQTGETP